MLGLIVWCIIIIIIAWCLLPWWVMPTFLILGFLWSLMNKKYY